MAEKVEKERLDVLLVQQGLANSRELAKAYIMAGNVYVDGQKEDKAGTKVAVTAKLEVKGNQMKYVSRGGYKLEKAMDVFGIRLNGKICLDIGASTGGFTDCMLQNGASKVYAIDVGYGQFAWKLRNDERVVCLEKTNVRYVTHEQVPDEGDFASIDVSFISLTKVLPAVLGVLGEKGQLVCLIKPQFEAGREKVGKKGVVRDSSVHREVIEMIVEYVRTQSLGILGLDFSPIKGPEGNIEYLIYLDKSRSGMHEDEVQARVDTVVAQSHKILSGEK
ncbi:TlyA family RNA methyltransferase [Anaerotignum faecicola]|uniref:TlyA family rRNA (Cytidine-2'-O)-methyltransferase n=1 Tax=Anaerotignum faecicola TaxID=2358141 RepID=A0A401LEZ8_9FIRM|nr:TlyA family RNA methyltransferase [Anaerotignum faecicola]RHR13119.1 TlyA family RNA methyltransferase [Firmicutes bacterium AF19-2LB]RHT41938.1 TlyA family RNA methyltransferase [Firmicutes bacterium AM29-6AC]GCB30118.1 TlyA family rRNA (cytidine-2'-O)-methyltransferase [Anaerotignum faecicola]HBD88060.1 TlyA family rRNA (cytidine-2'-O)-methyltransferase [Tyzzerella sp.]